MAANGKTSTFNHKREDMKNERNEQFKTPPVLDVYVAAIPKSATLGELFPTERNREVQACTNEKVKREKYFVWKLLEYAVKQTFGKNLQTLSFQKNENGKWTSKELEFSLSHANGVAAVALSLAPVGIDIQPIAPPKTEKVVLKILSEPEQTEYAALLKEEKAEYFTKKWTERESVFKMLNLPAFFPSLPALFDGKTIVKTLLIGGESYALAVASETTERLRLYENIDLCK